MTPGFCGGNLAPSPDCGPNSKSAEARTIGYYEGWNAQRPCGSECLDVSLGVPGRRLTLRVTSHEAE
jgi:chitinase